eukprot:5772_1
MAENTQRKQPNSSDPMAGLGMDFFEQDPQFKAMMEEFDKTDINDQKSMDAFVESMMGNVMTKEVMQEPIKALADRYPSWLEANESKLSSTDRAKYRKQFECCQTVLAACEADAEQGEILRLIQEMQSHGQPPSDLLEQLMPNVNLDGGLEEMMKGMPGMPGMEGVSDADRMKQMEREFAKMDEKCCVM